MAEGALQRAHRVANDPTAATDSDKLRVFASLVDAWDAERYDEAVGTEVQDWLRDLADRLEKPGG